MEDVMKGLPELVKDHAPAFKSFVEGFDDIEIAARPGGFHGAVLLTYAYPVFGGKGNEK